MLLAVRRVAVALPLRHVGLRDEDAVEVHLDLAADHLDLLEVPQARLAQVAAAGGEVLLLAPDLLAHVVAQRGHDAVHGARVLVGLELVLLRLAVVVLAAAVVEELQLAHAEVRGVLVHFGHADAEAVVAVLRHLELEAEDEVAELLLRAEVAARSLLVALREAGEHGGGLLLAGAAHFLRDRLDPVHLRGSAPAREVLPVEERDESLVDRFGVGGVAARPRAVRRGCRRARGEHRCHDFHVVVSWLLAPSGTD